MSAIALTAPYATAISACLALVANRSRFLFGTYLARGRAATTKICSAVMLVRDTGIESG